MKLIFKKNDCTLKPRPFLEPIKRNHEIKSTQVQQITRLLTLCILTSVCIFSILFSIHFLRCWQGEFVYQSKAYFIGNHFLYFHDLNMWLTGDIVGRNLMLVTLRGQRVELSLNSMNILTEWASGRSSHNSIARNSLSLLQAN